MTNYYGRASYWDDRYTKDPDPFDWYQRYSGLKDLLGQYLQKGDELLMAGCGNSRLSEDMYEDGYTRLTNIDISRVVIDQMAERCSAMPGMTWRQMNACALEFGDASFDAVLDKGTMDSILCGEGSINNVANLCMEVSRVLKPNGVFIVVSYGVPDNRLQYLQEETYKWRVTIHTVAKPTVSTVAAAAVDPKDANSVHYVYVCQKGQPIDAPPADTVAASEAPVEGNGMQEEEEVDDDVVAKEEDEEEQEPQQEQQEQQEQEQQEQEQQEQEQAAAAAAMDEEGGAEM